MIEPLAQDPGYTGSTLVKNLLARLVTHIILIIYINHISHRNALKESPDEKLNIF